MKNRYLFFGLFILSHFSFSQGRDNWFPNKGNVGIGTRTPSKDLEVIGDIKATNTIFSSTLESGSIVGGTLGLSGNAVINGRLGIGVPNPTEKLEVLGNFNLQGNLTAQGLSIQTLNASSGIFNTLTVNQTSLLNGMVGIGINPTEKLHVGGNQGNRF